MARRSIQYTIRVDLHEIKDLVLREGKKETIPSPYIDIIFNGTTKSTKGRTQVSNYIINESFNFTASLTPVEFNKSIIELRILHKYIIQTALIGSYTLSLKYIYNKAQHWIYRQWVKLLNGDIPEENVGVLLLTVGVFGPGDAVPVIDESLSTIAEGESTRINTGPDLKATFYNLSITIHKAQDIPVLPGIGNTVEPHVIVKFAGFSERTKTIKDINPEWNITIRLPSIIPCHDGNIIIELWNGDTNSILINSFIIDFFDLIKSEILPHWVNFYWFIPDEGVLGAVQTIIGRTDKSIPNSYGGRLLISASAIKVQSPNSKGMVPARITPDPGNIEHFVWVDLYEVSSQRFQSKKVRVEVKIGPHSLISHPLSSNELGYFLVDKLTGSFDELPIYLPGNIYT